MSMHCQINIIKHRKALEGDDNGRSKYFQPGEGAASCPERNQLYERFKARGYKNTADGRQPTGRY